MTEARAKGAGRGAAGIAALRAFARPRAADAGEAGERCDGCGAPLEAAHDHALDPRAREVRCACGPCAARLAGDGSGRWKRVPREAARLPDDAIDAVAWARLGVPVGIAYFVRDGASGAVVAHFPSALGLAEAPVAAAAWEALAAAHPRLAALAPDVEALLVHRVGGAREHYVAPVDACLALAGILRARWRGVSGGEGAWGEVARFFADLAARCEARRA